VYISRSTAVFPIVIWTQNIRLCTHQCLSCYRKAWNHLSIDIFTCIVATKFDIPSFIWAYFSFVKNLGKHVRSWQRYMREAQGTLGREWFGNIITKQFAIFFFFMLLGQTKLIEFVWNCHTFHSNNPRWKNFKDKIIYSLIYKFFFFIDHSKRNFKFKSKNFLPSTWVWKTVNG
jgi:hypothetical protein